MIFIILGARDQDIQNKREPCTAIRRSISQIQNDLTVFMKVQSFRGAMAPLAPAQHASLLKDSPTSRQVLHEPWPGHSHGPWIEIFRTDEKVAAKNENPSREFFLTDGFACR